MAQRRFLVNGARWQWRLEGRDVDAAKRRRTAKVMVSAERARFRWRRCYRVCGFKKKRKKATAELQRVGAAAWAADFDWMMRK